MECEFGVTRILRFTLIRRERRTGSKECRIQHRWKVLHMSSMIELKVCANKDQVEHAEEILAALGLSISEAIPMFLAQIVLHDGLPFEVVLPDMDSRDDGCVVTGFYCFLIKQRWFRLNHA